jgi:hypothetical protein
MAAFSNQDRVVMNSATMFWERTGFRWLMLMLCVPVGAMGAHIALGAPVNWMRLFASIGLMLYGIGQFVGRPVGVRRTPAVAATEWMMILGAGMLAAESIYGVVLPA